MTLASVDARADTPSKADVARAAELKKAGDTFAHASQFREALKAYDESYALVADPAILYNRGRAHEALGEFPEALDELERFVATAPSDLKSRVPNLEGRVQEIAHNVATLVVECPVAGATVVIRGKTSGTTPLAAPLRLSAGDAAIEVTAAGYKAFQKSATLAGGETTTIPIALEKDEPAKAEAPPPAAHDAKSDEAPSRMSSGWKAVTLTAGGVGVASLVTGVVFFGLALSDKSDADAHCPNKTCDPTGRASLNEAQTFATVSTVFVVVGALGLAAAATTFIVSPRHAPVQARLFVGPGYWTLGGTF
jgi:hypothetical protein